MSVTGKGDTHIELDGDNKLKSGAAHAGLEHNKTDTSGEDAEAVLTHRFTASSLTVGRSALVPRAVLCYTMGVEKSHTDRGKVTYGWRPSYSFHLF